MAPSVCTTFYYVAQMSVYWFPLHSTASEYFLLVPLNSPIGVHCFSNIMAPQVRIPFPLMAPQMCIQCPTCAHCFPLNGPMYLLTPQVCHSHKCNFYIFPPYLIWPRNVIWLHKEIFLFGPIYSILAPILLKCISEMYSKIVTQLKVVDLI